MQHSSSIFRLSSIIPWCIVVIILFIFWHSIDIDTYRQYHIGSEKSSPSRVFIDTAEVYRSPGDEVRIISLIENAKKRVYVALYTFTVPSLRLALSKAHDRGVDVRVILEKQPYQNITINHDTIDFLTEAGIPLHESGAGQFAFMHAKYRIIDERWIVSTANWTRSSFSKNREFFIEGQEMDVLADLTTMFLTDFAGKEGSLSHPALIGGPTNAHEKIIHYIHGARSEVDVYAPSLSDDAIIGALGESCRGGKHVRVILEYTPTSDNPLPDCVEARILGKMILHAKGIILDRETAFIGSFNFTKNSLTANRELGIFLSGEAVTTLVDTFDLDWQLAHLAPN